MTNNNFDSQKFNLEFEKQISLDKANNKDLDEERLAKLGAEDKKKNIIDLSLIEILIGIKDSWFDMLDDLLHLRFNLETFTKNNRLFFIGLTIIIIMIILYLYDIISEDDIDINKKVVEIRHVYKLEGDSNGDKIFKLIKNDIQSSNDSKLVDNLVTNVIALSPRGVDDYYSI